MCDKKEPRNSGLSTPEKCGQLSRELPLPLLWVPPLSSGNGEIIPEGLQVLTVCVPWSTGGARFAGIPCVWLPSLFSGLGPVQ